MKIHHITKENSVLNTFLSEIRDISVQKDRMRFRRNIERIGEILGYELSKTLNYEKKGIKTPLGEKKTLLINEKIVICSVLREGLPLHQGLLNYFDNADSSFISAYRHHDNNEDSFKIIVEYLASSSLNNKILILADPMLATGRSLVLTFETLKKMAIAAKEGIEYIKSHFDTDTHLWIADIDDDLDQRGYIIPGLGDAGDLSFGDKL